MGAGTEVGILADDGALANVDFSEAVYDGVIANGSAVFNSEGPRDFDVSGGADDDVYPDLCSKKPKQYPSISIPIVEAEFK